MMIFEYYVSIDATGHAGLAATKRSAVESLIAEKGGHMVMVQAVNAFDARRQAERLELAAH